MLKPNTFLITSESVDNRIFWCNLVEHLVTSTNDPKIFDTLISAFPHSHCKGTDTVVLIIQKVAVVPVLLVEEKVIKITVMQVMQ